MTPMTAILLILVGAVLMTLLLRSRASVRDGQLNSREEERLTIAAQICHAAARDTFGVALDGTRESIALVDSMIDRGWRTNGTTVTIDRDEQSDALSDSDTLPDDVFVLGCYLGNTLRETLHGEWRKDKTQHAWPYIYFALGDLAVSPFELIQRKLSEPGFNLDDAVSRLATDITARTTGSVTHWHDEHAASQSPDVEDAKDVAGEEEDRGIVG